MAYLPSGLTGEIYVIAPDDSCEDRSDELTCRARLREFLYLDPLNPCPHTSVFLMLEEDDDNDDAAPIHEAVRAELDQNRAQASTPRRVLLWQTRDVSPPPSIDVRSEEDKKLTPPFVKKLWMLRLQRRKVSIRNTYPGVFTVAHLVADPGLPGFLPRSPHLCDDPSERGARSVVWGVANTGFEVLVT
ncbi:hypothetical protein EPUS_01666 [Endocarpon pusillum Z07020]|uniref:Uncharacterized protein n=1 Tax=Endocarpon pusillum (strain Z07020 / HMAS-L-300199) TaxID=1263415 RepID=U1GIV8_ENDPU|nr:uncharacterized protein EPUS_01666 [Endocarpon pusillum Z07020]ERF71751.1 hypothetical protein EPUS_01666 [Endocarpon pusillum Z07020]